MTEAELELLIAAPGRQTEARSRLRDALDANPRTVNYKLWLSRLPAVEAPAARRPVLLMSSFTLETLEPFLQVEAYLSGWRAQTRYVQYGSWQNALLQPPGPEAVPSSAAVLLLHDAELLGEDFRVPPAQAVDRLHRLLSAWRSRCATPLMVGLVAAPPLLHGLAFGHAGERGPAQARAAFAQAVRDLCSTLGDVHFTDVQDVAAAGVGSAAAMGGATWFDAAAYLRTGSVFQHTALPAVARCLARHLGCLFRPRRKVLVLDMDNTLWGGVVGEDGVHGLKLGQDFPGSAFVAFQRIALALRQSGVLLALASKNNEADAMAVFAERPEMLLKPEHFSARRINWHDKAGNIASMADALGLGLDSFVFADDSALECAQVRQALPQVEVVELGTDPLRFVDKVLRTQAFDALQVSQEDRQRAASYQAEAGRQQLRTQVADMASFLADCQLQLALQPATPATLERVHQLMGKTNQFNFTLLRPDKAALHSVMEQGGQLYSAALTDRFGDYGLIGILHLQPVSAAAAGAAQAGDFHIVNLALSCRALGRGVEDALLAYARDRAAAAGCTRLCARVVRGPRNQQVLDYMDNRGFARALDNEHEVLFVMPVATPEAQSVTLAWPPFVGVQKPD